MKKCSLLKQGISYPVMGLFLFTAFFWASVSQAGEMPEWLSRITLSGTVELEAGFERIKPAEGDSEDSSSLTLATAELGVEAAITDHISTNVLFSYEDDEDVVVDEANFTLSWTPLYMTAGKLYVPFGKFETNMISDPLTQFGETRETAVVAGLEKNGFSAAAYIFNGAIDKVGDDDHIDNFGVSLGYAMENDTFSLDVGVGYINSIFDADMLDDATAEEAAEAAEMGVGFGWLEAPPGIAAHAIIGFGPVTLITEYVAALEKPEWELYEDSPGIWESLGITTNKIKGEKLSAWNAEVAYTTTLVEREVVFALAFQGSENGEALIPESRYVASAGIEVMEGVGMAVEYLHDEFENDDEADVVTAQLAVEF